MPLTNIANDAAAQTVTLTADSTPPSSARGSSTPTRVSSSSGGIRLASPSPSPSTTCRSAGWCERT